MLELSDPIDCPVLRERFIQMAVGFILMYSITSRNSFVRIPDYLREIAEIKGMAAEDVPIVLVGDKNDLEDEREVSTAEGEAISKELGCDFVEITAQTYDSVHRAIRRLVLAVDTKGIKKERLGLAKDTRKGN